MTIWIGTKNGNLWKYLNKFDRYILLADNSFKIAILYYIFNGADDVSNLITRIFANIIGLRMKNVL